MKKEIYSILDSMLSILIAGVAVVLLFPIGLIIMVLIRLDSKGNPIFVQKRVGVNGNTFNFYKFRTMVSNAEALKANLITHNEQDGPAFKMKNDPRITRIGRFLRKTSLDELPQFINVLKGEMAIVGPRPALPSEVEQYEEWQKKRYLVKPGITCIWQVCARNNVSFNEWMQMDIQYINERSFKLDCKLFMKTIKVMLQKTGQ